MKIRIDITRDNKPVKQPADTNTNKSSHKKMGLKKKVIYGGIATVLATPWIEKIAEVNKANDVQIAPTQVVKADDIKQTIEAQSETVVEQTPIEVEASNLLNSYASAVTFEEELAVDDIYVDKLVEVTGVIESVDSTSITLKNESSEKWYGEWMTVKCAFDDQSELEQIKSVQAGEEVSISGICQGLDGLSVRVSDCDLLENTLP